MQDSEQAERDRLLARYGKRFAKADVIFREGEPATVAFLLQEGRVRLVRRVRAVERTLNVVRVNELFGETALLDSALRTCSAIALTDGVALALDQETFRRLLEGNPPVATRLVQQLVRRVRDAEDQIEIMMLRDTQSKVVSALIRMAQSDAEPGKACVLDISPMDLASRVGLDLESVRRAVQHLREGQYIRVVDEHVEIPDIGALNELFALLSLKEEVRGSSQPQARSSKPPARSSKPPV